MSSVPFSHRHFGPDETETAHMVSAIGFSSLDDLIAATVPADIRLQDSMRLPAAVSEAEALAELSQIMGKNRVLKSFIGQGYYGTHVPPVIQRQILENPGWYTAYTPYQAEISQGRLEALLNFQTMVCDLTGMAIANASMLDEATAAAEAVALCHGAAAAGKGLTVFVDEAVYSQTLAVIRTRAEALSLRVVVGSWRELDPSALEMLFAVVISYPAADGSVHDYVDFVEKIHAAGAKVIVTSDLLALCLFRPPGEWGADVCVGSAQRFGVPFGYGGPHAAFFAVTDELKRRLPGRLIGVSIDSRGEPALRLTLQTREQHIRRDKATSNICTAQVLLAVMASMYAVYHGPEGLRTIAERVRSLTVRAQASLQTAGHKMLTSLCFDTLTMKVPDATRLHQAAREKGYNLREIDENTIGFSFDETTTEADLQAILSIFSAPDSPAVVQEISGPLRRQSQYLTHPTFQRYHTEHEMLRYLTRLERKDLALNQSMIPLGSCTMKLNAAVEMMPLSWASVAQIHPFVPADQAQGYHEMLTQLEEWLAEITGFSKVSLQPNAGSQGEYAGLLAIRDYHHSRGEAHRRACLIPTSAHGTNPASAVMAGFSVVPVKCDERGNIDLTDLKNQAEKYADTLGALMITYPSTHGVFEENIRAVCELIHQHGGQVYLDGANMNAQVGLTNPALIGADVCHLNLHKTFCIPHGGGGPGVGPVCVASHLVPFLPRERPVSAAPWGSASINTISWVYLRLMGAEGLTQATKLAILNANYISKKLAPHYPTLYTGAQGTVAHECILDLRPFKDTCGITVEDVAKRLIDYGYHAPTMSWPVAGTLMIEPTESESLAELDRFCEAMIAIRHEIRAIETGQADRQDNTLKNAPHPAVSVMADVWPHAYSRQQAAFPAAWLYEHKYWPPVARVDNVYGDKNLVCTCESVAAYAAASS